MRSLADYLCDRGWMVSGSDAVVPLSVRQHFLRRGIQVHQGHEAGNVPPECSAHIYSLAVGEENSERIAATRAGVPSFSYAEYLGQTLQNRRGIAIAGTHGKTTCSLLLHHLLQTAGYDAGLIAGGKLQQQDNSGHFGRESELIVEACEFRGSFLQLQPRLAAVLNVEADHFDCYPDGRSLLQAFRDFTHRIDRSGLLIANADCAATLRTIADSRCSVALFTTEPTATFLPDAEIWRISEIVESATGTSFTLRHNDELLSLALTVCGRHQVMNATAAGLLARQVGLSWESIAEGLRTFPGVDRRFHLRGRRNGAYLIDDYAHHPSELRATFQAVRQRFPGSYIRAFFQPHQIQRTEMLLDQFADALLEADETTILPIFAARETPDDRVRSTAEKLVEAGNSRGGRFAFCPSLDQMRSRLDDSRHVMTGSRAEVIVTLGAGNIDRIYDELPGFLC
ncbi:Mur ligase domain-containing protein [Rubinisphaera sp. ICM_H10]|nr:Mur ligase domain-containing protein [Rubinisphaera margarita]